MIVANPLTYSLTRAAADGPEYGSSSLPNLPCMFEAAMETNGWQPGSRENFLGIVKNEHHLS